MDRRILGVVPSIEIGDKYHCRVELVIIEIHHPFAAGIDSMEVDGKKVAISIVASVHYANETEFTDTLIYSGEGGNPAIKDRELKDQTLERGNLALKNKIAFLRDVEKKEIIEGDVKLPVLGFGA